METNDMVLSLAKLIESKRVATAYINGAPGSGKTILLQELSRELPKMVRHTRIFGPYPGNSVQGFMTLLIDDCFSSGYLEDKIPSIYLDDFIGAFDWLRKNLYVSSHQTIIILLDLKSTNLEEDTARSWFSSVRSLEHTWKDGPARLVVVVAGFWNHNLLDMYYHKIRLSFPYTLDENYFHWGGISVNQMDEMITRRFPSASPVIPYGRLLHEITGGHPGAAEDILYLIPNGKQLSICTLIDAVKEAACNGKMAQELVAEWSRLPSKAHAILYRLLMMQQLPLSSLQSYFDGLHASGLISEKNVGDTTYGVIRGWYFESVLRSHLNEIDIEETGLDKIETDEMIPPLVSINAEAYHLINEIENLARNFSLICLSKVSKKGENLLQGRVIKYDKHYQKNMDARERAIEWRESSREAGLPVNLNPLIAYLSISHLGMLIKELADEIRSEQWMQIADAIEATSGIRDAVMHNQLIDDSAFQKLFDLRAAIYDAMRPTSTSSN